MSEESKKEFTATEVGVLIESLQDSISIVGEGVTGLADRMDRFEVRLERVEDRLIRVEAGMTAIPEIFQRITRLESKARF